MNAREKSTPNVSELFAASVPRYTSYPTAPHFHAGITSTTYFGWLSSLPEGEPISIYVHIPFCDSLCWFCGCHTTVVNSYSPVRGYCDWLRKEIELVASALRKRRRVCHIHWGGGSPTLLQSSDIALLSSAIRTHFDVLPDAEFAIEIDPRGLSETTVKVLAAAGVNRASIGLQDCDIRVQTAINRIQSEDESAAAVSMMRAAGIGSINLDLIYGLPLQTLESWERTLDFAMWLNPDRLAVFGYAHVPAFKKHQALIRENDLPDLNMRFHLAEVASQILCTHGYVQIGLDHYAKHTDRLAQAAAAGKLRRNFQGYTTDDAQTLIGLGASAIGALPQGYVQNIAGVPGYRAALADGRLPIARGVALSDEDRVRRYAIERLMCDMEVDLNAAAARFGKKASMFEQSLSNLFDLEAQGIVTIGNGKVTIPHKWRAAVRLVCAAFDAYLAASAKRHSAAV